MGYTIWPDGPTGDVLSEVNQERYRQEDLRRKGKFPWTCADKGIANTSRLAILAEEFGEVAREVTEEIIEDAKGVSQEKIIQLRQKIRKELIQVAAVAIAWAEALEDYKEVIPRNVP